MLQMTLGCGVAFAAAVIVVYADGYQAIRKKLFNVPSLFWTSWPVAVLSFSCGAVAVLAYLFAGLYQESSEWLSTILGSRVDNLYLRALYTGLAVVTLIRSKLLQVRGADIGLEYLYSEFRMKCLGSVLGHWAEYRDKFIHNNLEKMFTIPDIETEIEDLIAARIEYADQDYKTSVNSQISEIKKSRPSTRPDKTAPDWRTYYRALINIALEKCGPEALARKGLN